jgi:hypothetical protein
MVMIPTLLYTHSSYSDVLSNFLSCYSKFGKSCLDITLLSDKENDFGLKQITYDDSKSYTDRLLDCLSQYDASHFMFLHEDFFLYAKPNLELLSDLSSIVREDDLDFIRLIRSGDSSYLIPSSRPNLYRTLNHFAVQAMICSKSYLLDRVSRNPDTNIWDLELKEMHNPSNGLYYYNGEPSRGGHFDSSVFPYMATAIVKGSWNPEYKHEILSLDINTEDRGWSQL